MKFELKKTLEIIERTPRVLYALLQGISNDWVYNNEGEKTWNVFDVVGHLIVCEKTDFIPRATIILSNSNNKTLAPLDMNAQFEWNKGKALPDLLKEFEQLRKESIQSLRKLNLTETDFQKTATHPKLGRLTLRELLATWVAHDLNHISQIVRVMAKQYKYEMGPFVDSVSIVK
jgi:uncharacterized damage-inducible protein DinB